MTTKRPDDPRSAFFANISHELRIPVSSIAGFCELACDDDIPPKTRNYLRKIRDASAQLLRLVNDILDFSKIEAGQLRLECVPFGLQELVASCQSIMLPAALSKGLVFYCSAPSGSSILPIGDPNRLRQSLLNLLDNAIKFTHRGTVTLTAELDRQARESINIRFTVKDTGIGMTEEQVRHIFEPFNQADESTARLYGGTGLGLPITKCFVELMGGALTVESAPGQGSVFSFTLCLPCAENNSHFLARQTAPKQQKPHFSGDALLCEDNALNREFITEHLNRVGLTVTAARNGQEGVEAVVSRRQNGQKPFDIIFMDVHMPVMDGIEASRRLRRINCPSPIIALSAGLTEDDAPCLQQGMSACLPKPFTVHDLWECLLRFLPSQSAISLRDNHSDFPHPTSMSHFIKEYEGFIRRFIQTLPSDRSAAHRMVHNLRSNAAIWSLSALQDAAATVEIELRNGADPSKTAMTALEKALDATIAQYPAVKTQARTPVGVKRPRILIVDDDEMQMQALRDILSPHYIILTARDGGEALAKTRSETPDLILLDILLPVMNGYGVLNALKQDVETQGIPIICVTGQRAIEDEERGFALGAADYIIKPYNPASVAVRVRTHLQISGYIHTIEHLCRLDALTGIANRRHFDHTLKNEWERAVNDRKPLSLLIIDVNKFKEYNDGYGHPQGDVLLCVLAQILEKVCCRPGDLAARLGGDEFAVLLPDTTLAAATALSRQIQGELSATPILTIDERKTYTTASIGVHAAYPSAKQNIQGFLAQGDKALYEAKRTVNGPRALGAHEGSPKHP